MHRRMFSLISNNENGVHLWTGPSVQQQQQEDRMDYGVATPDNAALSKVHVSGWQAYKGKSTMCSFIF